MHAVLARNYGARSHSIQAVLGEVVSLADGCLLLLHHVSGAFGDTL
jgi:hypothetical protein